MITSIHVCRNDNCIYVERDGLWYRLWQPAMAHAFIELRNSGSIRDGERTVLFNTGSGLSYSHLWNDAGREGTA